MPSQTHHHGSNAVGLELFTLILSIVLVWPTAIGQVAPPFVLAVYLFLRNLLVGTSLRMTIDGNIYLFVVFLLAMFASSISVEENERLVTFVRDLMIWLTAFAFFLLFAASSRRMPITNRGIINAYTLLFTIFAVTGLIYLVFPFSFNSLAFYLAPGEIRNTMLGERVLIKSFGEELYFFGFTDRIRSIFVAPNHLAMAMFLVFPIALHFRASIFWKAMIYLTSFGVLFFAQARLAMVCWLLFPLISLALDIITDRRKVLLSWLSGVIVFLSLATILFVYNDQIIEFINELFFERRRGSAEARSAIYTQTLSWILERPLFGYGTQQDVPGLLYPLGSHSTLLGVLFKHGAFAAFAIAAFLAIPLIRLAKSLTSIQKGRERKILNSALAGYLCYLMLSMLNEFIVDAYHTILLMTFIGVINGSTARYLSSGRRLARASKKSPGTYDIGSKVTNEETPGLQH